MIVLPKLYTREFPLILCEIWGRAYRRFLGREVRTFPRYVFLVRDGLVEAYRNEALARELNDLLLEMTKKEPTLLERFTAEYLRKFQKLSATWEKEFLDAHGLHQFAEEMVDFWQAIYAAMYVPPDPRFSEQDRELMADLRKKIDLAADKATHIILASVRHDYPELGPLANYVRLADLEWEEVPREPLERLAKGFVMVDEQIVTEEEFEQLKKRYQFTLEETRVPANVSELRGQPAMPGHAKGRVMLVQKREDVERFEKGRVLVSAMTVPDFVPAMSKAVAFVTDEGGITSHAAIVSRELGTPCVVGTKIATRALRDGDLVEVDASRGIVRVVERAAQ